jgi:16S rRNA (uracil1498-N3)-methyltransferase
VTTHVVTPVEFDDTEIEISGPAYQHLFRAKRLRVGEELRVVDGEGRARAVVALGSAVAALEASLRVELLVAAPKPDRAAWLVEKATELGAAAVRFVDCARAARDERSFGASQLVRLRRVAIAAVEQCGRARVPELRGPEPLGPLLERLAAPGVAALALDGEGMPAASAFASLVGVERLLVCVGPEGGWAPEEKTRFDAAAIARMTLGPSTLRVETAAVVGCGLALALLDRPRAAR